MASSTSPAVEEDDEFAAAEDVNCEFTMTITRPEVLGVPHTHTHAPPQTTNTTTTNTSLVMKEVAREGEADPPYSFTVAPALGCPLRHAARRVPRLCALDWDSHLRPSLLHQTPALIGNALHVFGHAQNFSQDGSKMLVSVDTAMDPPTAAQLRAIDGAGKYLRRRLPGLAVRLLYLVTEDTNEFRVNRFSLESGSVTAGRCRAISSMTPSTRRPSAATRGGTRWCSPWCPSWCTTSP
eukprot:TRINITY_DN6301_c0_g1_i2.p1 TRINITY_DN6301_c0_g1~~TRINITY_DN6301_c0_g1_i2.p1  ORF type:complete len:238 (-),score=29.35 TRINITY_DN6301_c0_g1_i2:83-796(-)